MDFKRILTSRSLLGRSLFTFRRTCSFILLLLALLDILVTSIAFQNLVELHFFTPMCIILGCGSYFILSRNIILLKLAVRHLTDMLK